VKLINVTSGRRETKAERRSTIGFVTVAERSTWAMMLSGFGVLGFLGYHKVRQGTWRPESYFKNADGDGGSRGAALFFRAHRGVERRARAYLRKFVRASSTIPSPRPLRIAFTM
jgi:hypothetical protein